MLMPAMSNHRGNSCAKGTHHTMIEVLSEIMVHLCHSDLRRLRFVNRKFYSLVEAYLAQFQKGLTALPNEIILDVVRNLSAQDQSRLARVSHGFYRLVMDSILRDNVRYRRSSLLRFSVKKNLKSLTRRIVYRGGDLNTTAGYSRRSAMLPRPLSIAAYYGYEGMVELLIELGAHPSGQGKDIPLVFAILKRHERVALILLQSSDSINGNPYITGGKLLQMACAAKMVTLVSHLLERRSDLHTREVDTALYHVLLGEISKENILKRAFHHEVFQIVLMLLQSGASPDVQPRGKIVPTLVTARLLSSRHPDPRVRAVLLDTMNLPHLKEMNKSESRVGRSWIVSSEVEDAAAKDAGPPDSYDNQVLLARLGDFLDKPNDEIPLAMEDQDITDYQNFQDVGMHYRHSTFFDLEAFFEKLKQAKATEGPLTAETFSSDAFPQLGTPKELTQQAIRGIWASPNPSVHSSYSPPIRSPNSRSTIVTDRKSPHPTELFPQLALPSQKPKNIERCMWTDILKGRSTGETGAVGLTLADKHEGEANGTYVKSKKKKAKWLPLPM